MALHPNFPPDPHAILDPAIRWFPADEALRTTSFEKLLPPLVPTLRKEVQAFRDGGYDGATETSRSEAEIAMFHCHVCGHDAAKSELVSEVFNLEGRRVLVENIPALVCEHCGEAASWLLKRCWNRF